VSRLEDDLYEALKATQFGFSLNRCPVCAGWMVGPYGETDRVHTKKCIVAKALKRYEKESKQ
jgi:hypothetical protein